MKQNFVCVFVKTIFNFKGGDFNWREDVCKVTFPALTNYVEATEMNTKMRVTNGVVFHYVEI